MFKQSRFVFLTVTLLLVLFASLARPMAVYADDSAPPPPATEEPANPPTEEAPVETESAPTEVPSEPAATDTPAEPASETESEPIEVSEILEAAPEGTEVVVLDENSEVVPLASQEAAEIVAVTDPMWCPAGVLPGGAGCSINFANSQALIDDMDNSNPNTTNSIYEQDGTIYFTADPGGSFLLLRGSEIQNLDYDALKVYNLTLQGGWNGLNDGAGFALGGQTDFGANRVQIGTSANPWAGNITINNFSINGVVNNSGLIVYTDGAISLNSVNSQNNTGTSQSTTGYGAYLVNTSGNNDVTVQNSSFENNARSGLRVSSNGNVSISSSNSTGNSIDGFQALTAGNITLSDVIANGNTEWGAFLINDIGEGNVTVSNSTFDSNTSTGQDVGLGIFSAGDVTLVEVSASNNLAGSGSYIAAGSLVIENSIFNNNSSNSPESGQGLFAEADEAEIICSQFSGNATYGLDATLVGLLTLDDVVFGGNGSGDYLHLGSPFVTTGGCSSEEGGGEEGGGEGEEGGSEGEEVEGEELEGEEEEGEEESSSGPAEIIPLTSLSLNMVSVIGSEKIELNCGAFSGTKLILPNGDSLILPCPIRDEGSLMAQAQDGLPGQLDDQFGFLSAMNTGVIRDGQPLSLVDTGMIVEFVIPDGQNAENLAILHWDGSKWVEFPGNVTADGHFAVTTNFTGVFVLVTK
jgi:hypothetical protein